MADPKADRHKVRAVPYYPATADERAWLVRHATAAGRTMTDILRQAVAEYRARVEDSASELDGPDRALLDAINRAGPETFASLPEHGEYRASAGCPDMACEELNAAREWWLLSMPYAGRTPADEEVLAAYAARTASGESEE